MINIAWDRSYENKKSTKKAISERGWNPLNRALLLDKAILKTQRNTQQPSSSTGEDSTRQEVNVDTGNAANVIDRLSDKQEHVAARERALKRHSDAEETKVGLKRGRAVTSGKLVAAGSHRITRGVAEIIEENADIKAAAERKTATNRYLKRVKRHADVAEVKKKPEDEWNVKDYAVLLGYKKEKGDLKLSTTLPGLAAQWAIRSERESPAKPKPQQPMPGLSREGIREEEDSDDEGGGTTNLHDQLVCI